MGVTTFNQEYKCPVAPGRMFKALILDSHSIMPKLAPHAIKSIEIVGGDGGPETVKRTQFADGSQFKYMKHVIDEIDTKKFMCKYSLIEGDLLVDKLQSITYVIKFEASSDGGSIITTTCENHTKDDAQLKEEMARKMHMDSPKSLKITWLQTPMSMPEK